MDILKGSSKNTETMDIHVIVLGLLCPGNEHLYSVHVKKKRTKKGGVYSRVDYVAINVLQENSLLTHLLKGSFKSRETMDIHVSGLLCPGGNELLFPVHVKKNRTKEGGVYSRVD